MTMHLLMGVKKQYESEGTRLLLHVAHRYSIFANVYLVDYCYKSEPPSRAKDRAYVLYESRRRLEEIWIDNPGPIIGFGWMACELLTGRGKTRLKDTVGTRWTYVGNMSRSVWVSYDPSGALYNPNLVVDIASVVRAAGVEAGFQCKVNKAEPAFDWSKWI